MMVRHPSGHIRRKPIGRISDSANGLHYCTKRGKTGRVLGRAQRSYGKINLKVDPSQYLILKNELDPDPDSSAGSKLILDLKDLAHTQKGCIVWFTLEYFEISNKVVPYVDILLGMCLTNDYIMEITTKNFLLITNLVTFGESIKTHMFKSLKHIHEDILSFGHIDNSTENPHLLLKYYDHEIAYSYYKFVGLIFFRFRKHLDSYRRYRVLAKPTLCGLNYLLDEGSLESLQLFTRLMQLNFHALERFFYDELIQLVTKVHTVREHFITDDVKWKWLSGSLDIIYGGPILPRSLYNRYVKLLGDGWVENVVHPPVQVLERINEFVIQEKLHHFHVNDNDIIRNMFVYLP